MKYKQIYQKILAYNNLVLIVLTFLIVGFSCGDLYAKSCNDTRYDADADGMNEIRLCSECNIYYKLIFHKITQTIDSLSHTEWYVVDYKSAKFYQSPVKPWRIYTCEFTTLKACPEVNKGAAFTRTKPKPHSTVSVSTAPACMPGWVFKIVKDIFASVDTVSLDSTLTCRDNNTGIVATLINAHSECYWDQEQQLLRYTYTITNDYDEPMTFFANSAPSPSEPSGWNGIVQPHTTTELVYELSSMDTQNQPVEYTGSIDYVIGEDSAKGLIIFSTISPGFLTRVDEQTPDYSEVPYEEPTQYTEETPYDSEVPYEEPKMSYEEPTQYTEQTPDDSKMPSYEEPTQYTEQTPDDSKMPYEGPLPDPAQ